MKLGYDNEKNEISRWHYFYWIVILIGIIVFILTRDLGKNQNVINYFGFGGTLVSIILGLVAIFYSIYQGSSSVVSTEKLVKSAKNVEKVTKELKDLDISIIHKKLEELKNSHRSIENKLDSTSVEFKKLSKNLHKENGINESINDVKFKYTQEEFFSILNSSGVILIGTIILYLCYSKQKLCSCYSLSKFLEIRKSEDENRDADEKRVWAYASSLDTVLIFLNSLGAIKVSIVNDLVGYKIEEISPIVIDAVMKGIEAIEKGELSTGDYNYVKEYFAKKTILD